VSETQKEEDLVCDESKHRTPVFLRSDIAYSVLGVDCTGDRPAGMNERSSSAREPASMKVPDCGPHAHPPGLRSDWAYSETGVDCWGTDARSSSSFEDKTIRENTGDVYE